ncbi:efflux RND transporter permease subunit, partial [Thiolapillus sp.]
FFGTMAVIYLAGGELNIVVYTAIILALGMLVDDAVVVLENIERHLGEMHEDLDTAIEEGTREVLSPVFAGTIATIVIMFPLMFVGDFPQHIFRPLISTLIIALLVSYFLSITFIPKLSVYLYRNGTGKTRVEKLFEKLYQASFGRLVAPYLGILKFTHGRFSMWRKLLLTLGVLAILVVSLKNIMPIIGKDTMPPMDTGIIKAHVVFSANDRVEDSEQKIKPFLEWLHQQPEVVMSSVAFGSEAGVLSLGSGNLPSEATITVNCVNRFERQKTLWDIENEIRDRLHQLPGIKTADVYDFGATAISSIKAPLDVRIKSGDYENLPEVAQKIAKVLTPIKGLTSISQSWGSDFSEIKVDIDTNKALSYGLTPGAIVQQIPIRGQVLSLSGNLSSMSTQYVRLYLKGRFSEDIQSLKSMLIQTPKGEELPLTALAKVSHNLTQAKIERDQMLYSIDVNGYRATRPITHITADARAAV